MQFGVMDNVSFDRRVLYLFFLHALVFFYRFGGDSLRDFRGVIRLHVSCGSGDGSPSLATTDADCECAKHQEPQHQ